jgi:cytochrome b6-f complex iron-sulfur subunit
LSTFTKTHDGVRFVGVSGDRECDTQSRRRFLQTAAGAGVAFVIAGCTSHKKAGRLGLPYPAEPVFGERIDAGPLEHILSAITAQHSPYYVPAARAYVSRFPAADTAAAKAHYPTAIHASLDAGVVVIYQRCTHLGCRVPFCSSSQWFECPCHSALYDRVGECRDGPAPRGMDLMPAHVDHGHLFIESGTIVDGMPRGTNTTHQRPAGPFCVGSP